MGRCLFLLSQQRTWGSSERAFEAIMMGRAANFRGYASGESVLAIPFFEWHRLIEGKRTKLARQRTFCLALYRFCGASTSLSPLPLENTGLSIVPPIRKGNCNLPSFKVAPDSRAMVLVKKLSLVVISANPR